MKYEIMYIMCLVKCLKGFNCSKIAEMEPEQVTRMRGDRITQHSSVRRERGNPPPRRRRGRGRGRGDVEPEPEVPEIDMVEQMEQGGQAEDEGGLEDQQEDEEEVVEEQQVGFGGGPTNLELLPNFDKHIASKIWVGKVSFLNK